QSLALYRPEMHDSQNAQYGTDLGVAATVTAHSPCGIWVTGPGSRGELPKYYTGTRRRASLQLGVRFICLSLGSSSPQRRVRNANASRGRHSSGHRAGAPVLGSAEWSYVGLVAGPTRRGNIQHY